MWNQCESSHDHPFANAHGFIYWAPQKGPVIVEIDVKTLNSSIGNAPAFPNSMKNNESWVECSVKTLNYSLTISGSPTPPELGGDAIDRGSS